MAWKTLCNEVEILSQYPEVAHAIEDTSSPVPGYLFGEINALTYIDYGINCKPLVNFLVSKLEANSPFVSLKVLKLLIYLVKNGHTEMVTEVKFHEVALKEAMGFHGPPDSLHGKTFYEDIRKMSKELLEYVFSENKDISQNETPPAKSELLGYGSNATKQKLSGFGYSVKSEKSVSEKVSEGITTFVEKLLPPDKESQTGSGSHLAEALPQYKPLIISKSVDDFGDELTETKPTPVQAPAAVLRKKQKASVYKPGRPGGGWDDSEEEDNELEDAAEVLSKESCASADSIEFSKIELKESVIDWADEHNVVDEFTLNEDIHEKDLDYIKSTCMRCASLNCDKILTFLVENFTHDSMQVQLKSLLLLEFLVYCDIAAIESVNRIVLPAAQVIGEKESAAHLMVKQKANKLAQIIGRLYKIYQDRQPRRFIEIPITSSS